MRNVLPFHSKEAEKKNSPKNSAWSIITKLPPTKRVYKKCIGQDAHKCKAYENLFIIFWVTLATKFLPRTQPESDSSKGIFQK